jgi:serine/threonine protein kinase
MAQSLAKAEALFHEALELPTAERDAFLKKVCADPQLLQEVAALLRAAPVADFWLKEAPAGFAEVIQLGEGPGSLIDRYKLIERIGEGGFGVVYRAEQQEPIRREVGLKIIKLGMDTRSVVARFEVERQALALMDHPNIAKVFDAGATETGRPYFVMELVRGVQIIQFCRENQLSITEKLNLFMQVCSAIQHAHQKGIIHRDIKPTNILVAKEKGAPHPIVIDFGIAKALNQRLTEKTFFTSFAQMIGTPAYMSPEQAQMSKLEVDARSDIYSLGVLLYELLTGAPPFPEERLRSTGYAEMQRIIREEEPEKPSTRISRTTVAESRRFRNFALPSVGPKIGTDLDIIVLKCLEKDITRRYETTAALMADLERFLKNEPITARPPGSLYRIQKLVGRNRATVAAATLTLCAFSLALLATSLFSKRVTALRQPVKQTIRPELSSLRSRSSQTPPQLIDLSSFYNVSLEGNSGWQLAPSSPHAIQKGPQVFGGIHFDVRGAIRLGSSYKAYDRLGFPQRVEGITISQKCRRLHFLHFVFNSEQNDRMVATYSLRYANGKTSEVPVKYGSDVRTWAAFNVTSADPSDVLANTNSIIVWRGTNVAGFPVRIFRMTWENPNPDLEIETIDLVSNMTDCAPVVVGITLEP